MKRKKKEKGTKKKRRQELCVSYMHTYLSPRELSGSSRCSTSAGSMYEILQTLVCTESVRGRVRGCFALPRAAGAKVGYKSLNPVATEDYSFKEDVSCASRREIYCAAARKPLDETISNKLFAWRARGRHAEPSRHSVSPRGCIVRSFANTCKASRGWWIFFIVTLQVDERQNVSRTFKYFAAESWVDLCRAAKGLIFWRFEIETRRGCRVLFTRNGARTAPSSVLPLIESLWWIKVT